MGFEFSFDNPLNRDQESYWFCYQNDRLMVKVNDNKAVVPLLFDLDEIGIKPVRTQHLGRLNGVHCYSAELPLDMPWPENVSFLNFIELHNLLEKEMYQVAINAQQIVAWEKDHQFCGRCGARTRRKEKERAMACTDCGSLFFPRITPAIMVAIIKDNKILLAKNKTFPQGFYSVLAGFAEPGEQLEECVRREVKEEVGLEIKNITYFGSQPWPFPNSLMIAFTADYARNEIEVDGLEIIEADWFSAENLPRCPTGTLSIAGRIIDWFRKTYPN
ncbi:NAD(+) diphosphatase [bacterium]|nr:NAD(+) diphosphatase [bacterium]